MFIGAFISPKLDPYVRSGICTAFNKCGSTYDSLHGLFFGSKGFIANSVAGYLTFFDCSGGLPNARNWQWVSMPPYETAKDLVFASIKRSGFGLSIIRCGCLPQDLLKERKR
jgi:hypothetical protein